MTRLAVVDDLKAARVPVEGVTFGTNTKRDMANRLSINIEQERITYPPIEQLLNELKAYGYERTNAGNLKTSAPSGFYDDCVTALALCIFGLDELGSGRRQYAEAYWGFRAPSASPHLK